MTATTFPGNPVQIHADDGERAAILRSQKLLLAWLEDHPEAPLPVWGHNWMVSCRDGAEVERFVGEIGLAVDDCAAITRAQVRFGLVAYALYASKAQVAS